MNASEALKISQENWAENEQKYLTYVVGFQNKVETAAKEGKTFCNVAVIPSGQNGLMDFAASFFESQGYFVHFQGVSPTEVAVMVNWKQEPIGSRPYSQSIELNKLIN